MGLLERLRVARGMTVHPDRMARNLDIPLYLRAAVDVPVRWHLIGHLQRNKVKGGT